MASTDKWSAPEINVKADSAHCKFWCLWVWQIIHDRWHCSWLIKWVIFCQHCIQGKVFVCSHHVKIRKHIAHIAILSPAGKAWCGDRFQGVVTEIVDPLKSQKRIELTFPLKVASFTDAAVHWVSVH